MENTIENAMAFTQTCDLFTEKGISSWYDVMVAYAASVSPKLVLPSDEDKQNAYLNMYPEMEESDGFDDGFIEAWEAYESELRRLNPSLFK